MRPRPLRSTRTNTLFTYTTLFRADGSQRLADGEHLVVGDEDDQADGDAEALARTARAQREGHREERQEEHREAAHQAVVELGQHVCRGHAGRRRGAAVPELGRSEEHTSELQSLIRISYAVFCLQ